MFISHVMWTGSAAAAFLTLNGMESLLSHQYFKTENKTEMNSDVFTAVLPTLNNTNLTEPVNFTIQHKKVQYEQTSNNCIPLNLRTFNVQSLFFVSLVSQKVPESGMVTCVYWEDKTKEKEQNDEGGEEEETMRWSVEGCWVAYTDENYTVCSCSHLSTFALIMQIGEVYQISMYVVIVCC